VEPTRVSSAQVDLNPLIIKDRHETYELWPAKINISELLKACVHFPLRGPPRTRHRVSTTSGQRPETEVPQPLVQVQR